MTTLSRSAALFFIVLTSTLGALGKTKQEVQHAPLPEKVITAATIFIENDSGYAAIADNVYVDLKTWGKYQIVTSKQKADLVLVLTVISEQNGGTEAAYASSYNSKTGAWTSGTTTVPSVDTYHYTQMSLIDPITSEVAWQDRRIWWRKHHPTKELIDALHQRVMEQEKQVAISDK